MIGETTAQCLCCLTAYRDTNTLPHRKRQRIAGRAPRERRPGKQLPEDAVCCRPAEARWFKYHRDEHDTITRTLHCSVAEGPFRRLIIHCGREAGS